MPTNESRTWRIVEWIGLLSVAFVGAIITGVVMLGDVKAGIAKNTEAIHSNESADKASDKVSGERDINLKEWLLRIEQKLDKVLGELR